MADETTPLYPGGGDTARLQGRYVSPEAPSSAQVLAWDTVLAEWRPQNLTAAGALNFKSVTDCSGNPNYPSAVKGDAYLVSVAGKIGGASGTVVDVGDWYIATADNAGGTEASVGSSWGHMEHNLVGAMLASNNLSDLGNVGTARTNLGLVIGTNVQAWNTNLDTWATKTPYAGTLTITTGKTFNVTGTLTLAGTDSSTLNIGTGGTLGTAAYTASSAYDVAGAAAAVTPTTLGLVIGTNVQAYDAALTALSGGSDFVQFTGPTTSTKIKTVRDAADTILELGGSYTPTGTWTNLTLVTPAIGTPASGVVTNLTGTASININGTVGATTPAAGAFTSETFTLSSKSTTALATPLALLATQYTAFASTISGASIMGFGTTNDVSLMNRAGTVCLGVGPNTTAINIPGTLSVTGALTAAGLATANSVNIGGTADPGAGNLSVTGTVTGNVIAAQNTQNAAYTFVLTDGGKHIFHSEATTARTYTIPANSSVAFPIGTMITIVNASGSGAITLAITTDTLSRGDGTAGTGSRTIAASAIATIIKTTATEWYISGSFT